jgi:hypothetical protein
VDSWENLEERNICTDKERAGFECANFYEKTRKNHLKATIFDW